MGRKPAIDWHVIDCLEPDVRLANKVARVPSLAQLFRKQRHAKWGPVGANVGLRAPNVHRKASRKEAPACRRAVPSEASVARE